MIFLSPSLLTSNQSISKRFDSIFNLGLKSVYSISITITIISHLAHGYCHSNRLFCFQFLLGIKTTLGQVINKETHRT